jgi:hypothetical protein
LGLRANALLQAADHADRAHGNMSAGESIASSGTDQ